MNNKRLAWALVLLISASALLFLLVQQLDLSVKRTEIPLPNILDIQPSIENGKYVYTAAGCSSCHATEKSENRLELGGGKSFQTNYGVFYAPNVSMSNEHGIGSWSFSDFHNAVRNGESPDGDHYYPSFPFGAYRNITDKDIVDLWSFWQTLPVVESSSKAHNLNFPFSIRNLMWFWKKISLREGWVFETKDSRGTYLVEALAHCAECHTPRNQLGGLITTSWLRGGRNPSGEGTIPDILKSTYDWSVEEIEEYLLSGFTPDFDTAGGSMVEVIENTRLLTNKDRRAIADYIKLYSGVGQ